MDSTRSQDQARSAQTFDRRTLLRGLAGGIAAAGSTFRAASVGAQPATPIPSTSGAELLWDTWGVPHIFADEAPGLFFGLGWAQTHAHGDVLLRLFAEARGRGAEFYGRDALPFDQLVRTMGIPRRGETWYAGQPKEFQANIDAFASGINAYAAQYPDRLATPGMGILPVTGADVMAHAARICFEFVAGQSDILELVTGRGKSGSNGWAVAPSYSASGNAMLLANPHLPWNGEYLWFEAQLVAPGVYDAYGATLVGIPVLGIAFNDYLGWTHTVNTLDGADVYRLTPDGNGYLLDGATRAFETATETITVLGDDGSLWDEPLVVRRSVHGPVIETNGELLAIRCTAVDEWSSSAGVLEQWWDMARATNLAEFQTVLKRLQIPIFTVIYADRDGHILSFFGGQTPVRPAGIENWLNPVPGDTSDTIWTEIHPYEELPRVVDPPSGWVQNSNSAPWYTTFPLQLDPDAFPPYLATRELSLREIRGIRMLVEHPGMTFEQLVDLKYSARFELADRVLDDLLAVAGASGDETARRAAVVLAEWDREARPESTGALLFARWALSGGGRSPATSFAVPLDPAEPLSTPSGLADPSAAVAALIDAANEVESQFGRLDVPWGAVVRLHAGDFDEPANGAGGDPFGVFRVLEADPWEIGPGRPTTVTFGDSYVAAVEFSNPVRAKTLVTYGNASQPGSPHVGDQLPLAARGELRPVWRTRAEIDANLEFMESI
jgi:acyl-homoserine-lactone acylase